MATWLLGVIQLAGTLMTTGMEGEVVMEKADVAISLKLRHPHMYRP